MVKWQISPEVQKGPLVRLKDLYPKHLLTFQDDEADIFLSAPQRGPVYAYSRTKFYLSLEERETNLPAAPAKAPSFIISRPLILLQSYLALCGSTGTQQCGELSQVT